MKTTFPYKILHVLSQRPSFTGSGITLDSFVQYAKLAGWDQQVIVGVPRDDPQPQVGGLPPVKIRPLYFNDCPIDFPVPGMSDVMPYPSTRFSEMSVRQLQDYLACWNNHLNQTINEFQPDIIHSHHIWLVSSILKDVAPEIPTVTQCHATGFRQMELCPHLAEQVKIGCSRNDHFFVLRADHSEQLSNILNIPPEKISVIGAGFRNDLFHAEGRQVHNPYSLLYIGKYSAAKGLPWLLDAVESLENEFSGLTLHVAGSGAGSEADALKGRMEAMAPLVKIHGQLRQPELAEIMRRSAVCVLPSFYEGLPLVLVEALACGCRLVATRLPGIVEQLAPNLGSALELVPLPRLAGVDIPLEDDLPVFVQNLAAALSRTLKKPALDTNSREWENMLRPYAWQTVFERVEKVWLKLIV